MIGAHVLDPHAERARINFSWILKLRWAAVTGQLLTVLVVRFGLDITLPLLALSSILVVEACSNAILERWFRTQLKRRTWHESANQSEKLLGVVMTLDLFFLTGLLYFTGGPSNPFSVFYLVNIVLAAVVVPWRWAWWIGLVAIAGYVALFVLDPRLPPLEPLQLTEGGRIHARGLLVAFTAAALFAVYSITRVTDELIRREGELSEERQRIARSERLEALATVAAGAAHELASPLSTIAVVAKELEIQLKRLGVDEFAVEDAHLIRDEVARCRLILDQMSVDAGESRIAGLGHHGIAEILDAAVNGLREAKRVEIVIDGSFTERPIFVALQTLALAFRGPIKNALDASGADDPVVVRASIEEEWLVVLISDRGTGMTPQVVQRASDPFFTTKEPGQGMGLGLFLSNSVIERLGGRLEFESIQGRGTEVTARIPLDRLRQHENP